MTALYGLAYAETALAFLKEAVPAKIRGQLKRKIDRLAANPHPPGCKKLHGYSENEESVYRIRSGDFRVLYAVRGNPHQVVILEIGDRKDIYK